MNFNTYDYFCNTDLWLFLRSPLQKTSTVMPLLCPRLNRLIVLRPNHVTMYRGLPRSDNPSVRKIEEGAFAWCHFIRPTIIIPDSGIYIDCMAFTPVGGRITFKSKDFQVSCPCWLWGQCGEDKKLARFYNDPTTDNFDKIKETDYKIPMALLRFFGHDEEEYHDYIKRHITQIANLMINENNCILINKILAAGFVTKNNINRLIDHAEEKEQTEITALLKEHKNKHFGNVSINKEV